MQASCSTIEECKNRGSASGFDIATNQEYENLICTHPVYNGTSSMARGVKTLTREKIVVVVYCDI
jgi:hypothetical protein